MAKSQTPDEIKAAKTEAKAKAKAQSKQRRTQVWQAFQMQRKEDARLLPYMIGAFLLVLAGLGRAGHLHRRLRHVPDDRARYRARSDGGLHRVQPPRPEVGLRKAEGQTGAAAWALENMRGKWRVTPGVGVNGHFDAVHRVIGRPGVILVAEGFTVPGEIASGAREEHRTTDRRDPDL